MEALVTTTRERYGECQYAAVNTFEDNQGAFALSKNPVFAQNGRILSHIGIVLGRELIYGQHEQKQQLCNISLWHIENSF